MWDISRKEALVSAVVEEDVGRLPQLDCGGDEGNAGPIVAAFIRELSNAGHHVLGLTRSAEATVDCC
jgi:hypothetical protein